MDRHPHAGDQSLSWLERAANGTPIIDGATATFVWQGARPPLWIGDLNDWDPERAATLRRAAPGVWMHSIDLPLDAYVEYAFLLDGERVPDLFNARTTPNGFGAFNHYFYMPKAGPTSLARRRRGVPHGEVSRHRVPTGGLVLGEQRGVTLYRPPGGGPCPLLVVWDGQDYRRRARLPDMVDNLIAEGRMRPVALALVDNAGQRGRMVEYACCEATMMFLLGQVWPLARAELSLIEPDEQPGAHGVCGASMGGLMALFTALRAPQIFGHVLGQSGAFTFTGYDLVVFDLVRAAPAGSLKMWMDVGRYEWLQPASQNMHRLLAEKGHDVAYREYNGGHNYPAWRDDVWRGLEWLFGPK